MTVKITDTTLRDGHQSLPTWRDLRGVIIAGALLVAVAFLPWQQRHVEIRTVDPIPASFPDKLELQRDISEAESGDFVVAGYDVHKATPFGDGILTAALGVFAAVVGLCMLATRRWSTLALVAIAGAALAALTVSVYDNFMYKAFNDWSARDWHVWWRENSTVTMETEATFGMFVMFVVTAYLAWRSVSLVLRSSEDRSNLQIANPGPVARQ